MAEGKNRVGVARPTKMRLDLANARVEGVGLKGDGRDTLICQTEHLCA